MDLNRDWMLIYAIHRMKVGVLFRMAQTSDIEHLRLLSNTCLKCVGEIAFSGNFRASRREVNRIVRSWQ
jgi:hypothetical protein